MGILKGDNAYPKQIEKMLFVTTLLNLTEPSYRDLLEAISFEVRADETKLKTCTAELSTIVLLANWLWPRLTEKNINLSADLVTVTTRDFSIPDTTH